MEQDPSPEEPPAPTDLEGWRLAISQGSLPMFRLETIVAALQDLGLLADSRVRNPLAKHLSDAMTHLLRKLVGPNHPNQGEDIIYRVHGQLFAALLEPSSADGQGLRQAFVPRVSFRIKDAIATERKHSRIRVEAKIKTTVKGKKIDEIVQIVPTEEPPEAANDLNARDEEAAVRTANRDLSLLNGVRDFDERLDVERFLTIVTDERKRLAFYLYMDDVPFGSKRGNSIAKALGVSAKTAREWVEEVRQILEGDAEIQELKKASSGDNT
jgi:hypothetical protein